jgi:hypothetical protein
MCFSQVDVTLRSERVAKRFELVKVLAAQLVVLRVQFATAILENFSLWYRIPLAHPGVNALNPQLDLSAPAVLSGIWTLRDIRLDRRRRCDRRLTVSLVGVNWRRNHRVRRSDFTDSRISSARLIAEDSHATLATLKHRSQQKRIASLLGFREVRSSLFTRFDCLLSFSWLPVCLGSNTGNGEMKGHNQNDRNGASRRPKYSFPVVFPVHRPIGACGE